MVRLASKSAVALRGVSRRSTPAFQPMLLVVLRNRPSLNVILLGLHFRDTGTFILVIAFNCDLMARVCSYEGRGIECLAEEFGLGLGLGYG